MPSIEALEIYTRFQKKAVITVPKRLAAEMGLSTGSRYPITITKLQKSKKRGVPGYVYFEYKHPTSKKVCTAKVRPQSVTVGGEPGT